ncbi:uncharacterized protein LOC143808949 [Ranitomeya variabilis]|uniref:uncharacterized protein LOC143808949 n=1 Tax=Ranitomeya variabilis TaxID=490064 RepID=UPI0040561E70
MMSYDPVTQVQPFQKKLRDTITKSEQEIVAGKKAKLQRDKQDYERGTAFKWKHSGNRRPQSTSAHTSLGATGEHSLSDFFSVGYKRHGRRTRRGKRNKTRQATTLAASTGAEKGWQTPEVTNNQLQIINLSKHTLSEAERKSILKALHHKPEILPDSSIAVDRRVFTDLLDLLNENDTIPVEFLDLRLIRQGDTIFTDLYCKSTAANGLLDYRSFHPHHLKKNLLVGQFYRIRQVTFVLRASRSQHVYRQEDILDLLSQMLYSALKLFREKNCYNQLKSTQTIALDLFHNHWNNVSELFKQHWDILKTDSKVADLLPEYPLLTARRAPNLRDSLSRSHFIRPTMRVGRGLTLRGMYLCGDCNICPFVSKGSSFTNPGDASVHTLRDYMNCKTMNLIYVIVCSCPMVYVEQTSQELRKRIQQHISNINCARQDLSKGKNISTVAMHFLQVHSSSTHDLRVQGLQMVPNNLRKTDRQGELLRLEARWIFQLGSVAPGGLNEDLLYTGFLLS